MKRPLTMPAIIALSFLVGVGANNAFASKEVVFCKARDHSARTDSYPWVAFYGDVVGYHGEHGSTRRAERSFRRQIATYIRDVYSRNVDRDDLSVICWVGDDFGRLDAKLEENARNEEKLGYPVEKNIYWEP